MKKITVLFLIIINLFYFTLPVYSETEIEQASQNTTYNEEVDLEADETETFNNIKIRGGVTYNKNTKQNNKQKISEKKPKNVWREIGDQITIVGYSTNESGNSQQLLVAKDYYKPNTWTKIVEGVGLFTILQLSMFGLVSGSRTTFYSGVKIKF